MEWLQLTSESEIGHIDQQSFLTPVVIFKHSTTCSISRMAINRLEGKQAPTGIPFYYLDLLRFRSVSNEVASHYGIRHESPQVLIIRNGKCIYTESHNGISMLDIEAELNTLKTAQAH